MRGDSLGENESARRHHGRELWVSVDRVKIEDFGTPHKCLCSMNFNHLDSGPFSRLRAEEDDQGLTCQFRNR